MHVPPAGQVPLPATVTQGPFWIPSIAVHVKPVVAKFGMLQQSEEVGVPALVTHVPVSPVGQDVVIQGPRSAPFPAN